MIRRYRYICGAVLGLALFFLHQVGPIAGALNPPKGYEPAWAIRNLDLPQYITWIAAARHSVLLPDYHAPWVTEPAMFQPLFAMASWIPLPPMDAYYLLSALLYICAGIALIYAASEFCPGLEGYALLAAACAVPLGLLMFGIGGLFHSLPLLALGLAGILDYSYTSADGLFRGGLGAELTLSAGTALMLVFMALLARFVKNGRLRLAVGLAAVSFAGAFFHPFEVYVMIAASAVPLIQCGRWRVWVGIALAALMGIAPHLMAASRTEWLRDVAGSVPNAMYPFWVPENFGIPFVAVVYLLLIRFRMADSGDRVLQSWLLATIALAMIPRFTLASHLFDGFAYCVGFLLVRRLATDQRLMPVLARQRRGAIAVVAGIAALSGMSLFLLYQQIWQDAERAKPQWLLSSVRPVSERPLLEWLRTHASAGTLVLSPADLAPWIATVPMTSFASHDVFSITFEKQVKQAEAFFQGEDRTLIENYGVGIVVAPLGSPVVKELPEAAYRTTIGQWRVYEFPEARMKKYPGLASLEPGVAAPLRTRILGWLSHLFSR